MDFSDQQAVFRDLQNKYGHDNVARIVAFGRMTPRAVIRKVFSTFGHDMRLISRITGLVPDLCKSLQVALDGNAELRSYQKEFKREFDVIERLQNVISHESQHAGGVVIYEGLGKHVPLKYDRQEKIHVAQWDKYMLEALAFFKFDVLGLETLPIVRNTLNLIEEHEGVKINLADIDKEDQAVYQDLQQGKVSGVFQINNQAGKVVQQKPANFRDLIAINAAIRPGTCDWDEYIARRDGKEYTYMKERVWLAETQGLMMYQEQYLLDGHHLAGWDIAFADKNLRKNKNIREDEPLRDKFISDAVARGYNESDIRSVWEEIVGVVGGGYSFNKSHAASYAMLTYQTAWLKHYYPTYFYSAMMSQTKTDGDGQLEVAKYIAECKADDITILPPDINISTEDFVPTKEGVTYRLTMIKHVGEAPVKEIKSLRPITSFQDFLERKSSNVMKKNVVINLVKAGAFDSLNPKREDLLWEFDMFNRKKTQIKNNFQCERYEATERTYMDWEKEVLGLYIKKHPMEQFGFHPLSTFAEKEVCIQGGEVKAVATVPQKNGKLMSFVTLDTLFGTIRVLVFGNNWEKYEVQNLFKIGNLVLVKGEKSGDAVLFNSGEELEWKTT